VKHTQAAQREAGVSRSFCAPRRDFLIGMAALGAASLIPGAALAAQTQGAVPARPYRIDTHHHIASPAFIAEITARKTGQHALQEWTPEKAIEAIPNCGDVSIEAERSGNSEERRSRPNSRSRSSVRVLRKSVRLPSWINSW